MRTKRIKLSPEQYNKLKLIVLKRDKWKCRCCGRRNNLHVHHVKFRSNGGDDTQFNLLTLCNEHHEDIHHRRMVIVQNNSNININADEDVSFLKVD